MRRALFALALAACVPPGGADIGEIDQGQTVCAAGTTTYGVDVSHYDVVNNVPIDWVKVKQQNYEFAFMKCTEGTTYFDPTFTMNWANSGSAGVIHGAYHFFHPKDDPIAQADFFVQKCGVPQAGDLPMALDLETTDMEPGATVKAATELFLQEVFAKTGVTPVVYTSASFIASLGAGNVPNIGQYPLWVAHWDVMCPNIPNPPYSNWTFWQSVATGTLDGGISGMMNVDIDQFNGSLSDLQTFVNPQASGDLGSAGDLAGGANGDLAAGAGDMQAFDAGVDGSIKGGGKHGCGCSLGEKADSHNDSHTPLLLWLIAIALVTRRRWWAACRR